MTPIEELKARLDLDVLEIDQDGRVYLHCGRALTPEELAQILGLAQAVAGGDA